MSKRPLSEAAEAVATTESSGAKRQKQVHSGVTPMPLLTEWTLADIPRAYPPLPPIPDSNLARMATTHRGVNEQENYETLEFLGDSFIYHVASEIVTQTFPLLSAGRKSQLREGLLRNSNLAQYTVHYGLDKLADIPVEFQGGGREGGTKATDKERQKLNGDLFEAYVGALIRARPPAGHDEGYDGRMVATQWLRSLWAMTLTREIQREHRRRGTTPPAWSSVAATDDPYDGSDAGRADTNGSRTMTASDHANAITDQRDGEGAGPMVTASAAKTPPAKVRLAAAISCKGVVIRYENIEGYNKRDKYTNLPLFKVEVWVDAWGLSECLAQGTALKIKEAGERAAEQALANGKKMKFYMAKKKEHLALREEQAQAQAQAQA